MMQGSSHEGSQQEEAKQEMRGGLKKEDLQEEAGYRV